MSRIGKKPIAIPKNVQLTLGEGLVTAKGPLGELSVRYPNVLRVAQEDQDLRVEQVSKSSRAQALWGLHRSLIANIVQGVSEGFEKKLEIEGVGYRAEAKGNELILHVGYSQPRSLVMPEGIKLNVEKLTIVVSGVDKQQVGQVAADIRAVRKPEPYKGKGIRYAGEKIRRKQGKRAAASA